MVDTFQGGSFATPEELKEKLKFLGDEYTPAQLKKELEAANRKLRGMVGRYYCQQYRFSYEDDNATNPTIDLTFAPIYEFDRMVINGELESSSNYSVATETGLLTFTTATNATIGALAELYYVPEIYKDLEILLAGKSILMFTYMHTDDEIKGIKTEQLDTAIKDLVNTINSKNPPRKARDYGSR
jgi:hypothetical protein